MAFDNVAGAVDWLDAYRAKSLDVLNLYAEDAAIFCGCGSDKRLSGRQELQAYWTARFDAKPAGQLIDLDALGDGSVAVTYRTPVEIVQAVLGFDTATGLITLQRCGPIPEQQPGRSPQTPGAEAERQAMKAKADKLRADAAECALIRDLATEHKKRELFDRLAIHLDTLAAEVERRIAADDGGRQGFRAPGQPGSLP